jgi:hypothetical protein
LAQSSKYPTHEDSQGKQTAHLEVKDDWGFLLHMDRHAVFEELPGTLPKSAQEIIFEDTF